MYADDFIFCLFYLLIYYFEYFCILECASQQHFEQTWNDLSSKFSSERNRAKAHSPSLAILTLDVVRDIWWRGRGQVTGVTASGQELARLLGRPETANKFLPFLPPVRLLWRGPGLNWSQNKGKVGWKSLKYSQSLPCFYCYCCCCFFLDIARPLCPLPGLWWHQTVSSSLTLSFYK